jgi:hypothetical protein
MAPVSNTEMGGETLLSTSAGMRLLGLIARNSGLNWSQRPMFTQCVS